MLPGHQSGRRERGDRKELCAHLLQKRFNIGLPILESEEAFKSFDEGSPIQVDLESGRSWEQRRVHVTAKPILLS